MNGETGDIITPETADAVHDSGISDVQQSAKDGQPENGGEDNIPEAPKVEVNIDTANQKNGDENVQQVVIDTESVMESKSASQPVQILVNKPLCADYRSGSDSDTDSDSDSDSIDSENDSDSSSSDSETDSSDNGK